MWQFQTLYESNLNKKKKARKGSFEWPEKDDLRDGDFGLLSVMLNI